ncbi:hypothetical protein KKC47_02785 [Patescibacteria group bacterium]|nr:hypothetical protein [Patescibacteria group bacterium]
MEITRVIIGNWFPRTKLHLKEYFDLLKHGTANAGLDLTRLKEIREELKPRNVRYIGGRFDCVKADFGKMTIAYHEDGLLTASLETSKYQPSTDQLQTFIKAQLTPLIGLLFAKGASVLSYGMSGNSQNTTIVLTKNSSEAELEKFCLEQGDEIHFVARHADRTVYFADRIIIIDEGAGGVSSMTQVTDNLILARSYERRLRDFLELYRTLWDKITTIQERKAIPSSELSLIRDQLLNYRRDVAITGARIGQMLVYLNERKSEIDDLGLTETLRSVEAYRFDKLISATDYTTKLWDMLKDYLDSTVEITGFFYQENLQKEIGIQQFIFLISAVATIIGLGSIAGASIMFLDTNGNELFDGLLSSFDYTALYKFGGLALLASLIIFLVVKPLIKRLYRIKPAKLLGRYRDPGKH